MMAGDENEQDLPPQKVEPRRKVPSSDSASEGRKAYSKPTLKKYAQIERITFS